MISDENQSRSVSLRLRPRTAGTLVALTLLDLTITLGTSGDSRVVLLPILAALNVSVVFLVVLWNRDGMLPLMDIGTVTVAITCLYTIIPAAGFWASGLRWTPVSYLPLINHDPGAAEVAAFTWRYVVYLAAFAAAYPLVRNTRTAVGTRLRVPSTAQVLAILAVAGALWLYFWVLRTAFGVDYDPTYAELLAGEVAPPGQGLPYFLQQVSHNLWHVLLVLKLAILMLLMRRWHQIPARLLMFGWLCAEIVGAVVNMGARTWAVMLLFAALLLYHRLVRPFSFRAAALASLALVSALLTYGVARDLIGGLGTVAEADYPPWATMNEFQAYFGIAYDVHARQAAGLVGPIPLQLYLWDLVALIPSQLLPFAKLDPCFGYPIVDTYGIGCIVGVVTQAVIGLDWFELWARGAALGMLFGFLHRWYSAHADGFWVTLLYLCMCIWSVYSFRASTFYFVYMLAYRFVPLLITVAVVTWFLKPLAAVWPQRVPIRAVR